MYLSPSLGFAQKCTLLAGDFNGQPGPVHDILEQLHLFSLPVPRRAAVNTDAGDEARRMHHGDTNMGADTNRLIRSGGRRRHLIAINPNIVDHDRPPCGVLRGDDRAEI